MDIARALGWMGLARPPAGDDDVAAVIGWLPLKTEDGKPLTWTRRDAERLLFVRWLVRTGRIHDK